jgi:hypothetical protein
LEEQDLAELEGLVVGIEADITPLLRALTRMESRVKASLEKVSREFEKLERLSANLGQSLGGPRGSGIDGVHSAPSLLSGTHLPEISTATETPEAPSSQQAVEALRDRTDAVRLASEAESALLRHTLDQTGAAQDAAAAHLQLADSLSSVGSETDILSQSLEALDGLSRGIGRNIAGAFEDAIIAGKSLSDILLGLERDLLRLLTRSLIIKPLGDAITGLLSGSGSGLASFFSTGSSLLGSLLSSIFSAPLFHDGGRVGSQKQPARAVSAGLFQEAPRFAGGGVVGFQPRLMPGEVPAILHRGETVRTAAQEAALQSAGGGDVVFSPGAIVINTPDPSSFLQARSQVEGALRDAVIRGVRNR